MSDCLTTNLFHPLDELLAQPDSAQTLRKTQQVYQMLEMKFPKELRLRLSQDSKFQKALCLRLQPKESAYLTVFNPSHYQALREALAQNHFKPLEGSPWPTAPLGQAGHAQLIPATLDPQDSLTPVEFGNWSNLMWTQRQQLSDLTVDVLDTLGAIWLKTAETPHDDALADLNTLLALRGLKQRIGRSGETRGFRESQRMEIFQALVQIQNLWLTLGQIESTETTPKGRKKRKIQTIQSRAFVITDRLGQLRLDGCIDVEKFIFRPGKVFGQFLFGPGRQTALLSARALSYDPYREAWEKRLTRYLSWHWRSNNAQQNGHLYTVKTLLDAIDAKLKPRNHQKSCERLEKALDKLQTDGVIEGWSYKSSPENDEVYALPPAESKDSYTLLAAAATFSESAVEKLGSKVHERRRKLKISQADLAKQFQVTQAYLSMLENGKTGSRQVNPDLIRQIYNWLAES